MEKTLLNLIPGACSPEVHLSQYDKGRAIPFKLAEGKSAYSVPDGSEIVVEATKPSGLGFVVPVTFDGDTATMTITETMSNEYGRFPAELSITKNGNKIGTANFVMNIERSPHPEGTIDGDAESLLPELTLLVERIEAAADSVDEDTQIVTEAKADVLQAKADTLQAKADTLSARADALQAKADAITAKESAEASAQAAAESAQEAEDTLSEYAKVDGYYEEMAVGSAEQLLSTQFVEDSVPYKFRTSGGSKDIGNREYDEIVGGSIVWNQLFQAYTGTVTMGGTTLVGSSNGEWTITGTLNDRTSRFGIQPTNNVKGHVYYMCGNTKPTDPLYMSSQSFGTDSNGKGTIIKNTATNSGWYYVFSVRDTAEIGSAVNMTAHPQVVDLTAMFGSTVADYIYSLEQAQSGKGVAFFKSLFPNDYYPYNAGELLSVEGLQSHDTVGFNAFDPTAFELGATYNPAEGTNISFGDSGATASGVNPINIDVSTSWKGVSFIADVVGNQQYQLTLKASAPTGDNIRISRYFIDENNVVVGTAYNATGNTTYNYNYMFTPPKNGLKLVVAVLSTTAQKIIISDPCLHLVWSGWRNGEYEPYKKHSYALDSSLTLRGILKLNAQNELYFDGDIYSHVGKVDRKYGVVDLGTLTWRSVDSAGNTFVYATLPNGEIHASSIVTGTGNGIASSKLVIIKKAYNELADGYAIVNANFINNTTPSIVTPLGSYADANAFKTAMSGVYLIYELATPTEETAEPFASPQAVDDFGTEEYISGNVVPVGHNTQYPANLRDKLQHLPNLADNDGYYMISQQNNQMSLELFRIPKAPTTDGTYILKATVSGGTPTYIWEAVE